MKRKTIPPWLSDHIRVTAEFEHERVLTGMQVLDIGLIYMDPLEPRPIDDVIKDYIGDIFETV